jgi:UDP-N-acetylglucosamine--dolichyl-phosphate N-acetylglucosaminephosphotransferase
MEELYVLMISFIFTYLSAPVFIRYLKRLNLEVKDMAKIRQTFVPISGGLIVLSGAFLSIMSYVFYHIFLLESTLSLVAIFAATTSMLIITMIGFMDDLLVRHSHGEYVGLKRWQKPLLTLPAAIPLMAVNVGVTGMAIPYFGYYEFGILYPLLLVPIGLVGASNMVNLLEGFNGIASGMGIIYMSSLGLFALTNGQSEAAIIAFAMAGALIAFFRFNFVPAKILPGDSLTYLLGAALASIAIIGNMERAALIVSVPFFIEFFLKLRGNFQVQTYGYALPNGYVGTSSKKIYSIPHILSRTRNYTEKQIVFFCMSIELFFSVLIWIL